MLVTRDLCRPSLMPDLYNYAGHNWFRHCRSYQDIALSQRTAQSTKELNHTLDIPMLHVFLGSFDCASIHFAEWVDWLKENEVYEGLVSLCRSVPSKPLSPAFAAVVCGLGELVGWLWHSEGADMRIKNEGHESLLYLASKYGTTWIMACIVARGTEYDINEAGPSGTALCGAAYSGMLENATLLLDQGADTNITFNGQYGTALATAAARGDLKMATLLLGRGANPDLTNNLGQKARDLAELEGRHEMVLFLDSYSAGHK